MQQRIDTTHFGPVARDPEAAIQFPAGLPAFENERGFVLLEMSACAPLVFLQSLADAGLCFITLPVGCVDPEYRLRVSEEDLGQLGFAPERQPAIGPDVVCLAVISVHENGPTANLLAPIVVNVDTLKAVQAIGPESGYSHQHPLVRPETAVG
jgi:flagellar assembly factor FliW